MRRGTYQTTTLIAVAVLLLILFVTVGYFFQIPTPETAPQESTAIAELANARASWAAARPAAFRYVLRRNCDCEPDTTTPYIASEQRSMKSARYRVPLEVADGEFREGPASPLWIDDLFAEIETALLDNSGARVAVSYDAQYAFPRELRIHYPQPDAAFHYQVQDFEVLEHRQAN